MNNIKVRLSGICYESLVNGEGLRRVYFAQGCKHNCKNCFNPCTHSFNGGKLFNIVDLTEDLLKHNTLDKVTFSGGDPFEQAFEFYNFAKILKQYNINIWCYTGYTYEEIIKDKNKFKLLELCDVLVDGKFIQELTDSSLKYRGSSNQRLINVKESLKQNKIILSKYN